MYLVPRAKERLFFYHEIWDARKSGIITPGRAKEATFALLTPKQLKQRGSIIS